METIHIATGEPYDVLLGERLLSRSGELLTEVCPSRRAVLLYDEQCTDRARLVLSSLEQAGLAVLYRPLAGGERRKTMEALTEILVYLAERDIRRNDLLIALGGGTVGDLAGFAAAVYRRGMGYVQIPTTLLAMVDASVGGKTGVDLSVGKNMVGAFHQPRRVLCDTSLPDTLPDNLYRGGLAEMLKCDLIRPCGILEALEASVSRREMAAYIAPCIRLKGELVARDEEDNRGIRRLLNAGHTVAHALEQCSGYTVSHGEAVATGLVWEAAIARELGLCGESLVCRLHAVAEQYRLYRDNPYPVALVLRAMARDKKNEDERITFILPTDHGCVERRLTGAELEQLWRSIHL